MTTEIQYFKCSGCKCKRAENEYEIYKGTRRKTCSICKEKRKKNKKVEPNNGFCEHYKKKYTCALCSNLFCEHGKNKYRCRYCGTGYCVHKRIEKTCKECNDPIKITVYNWRQSSKASDKINNIYDANNFIDECFLKSLVEDYPNCYYDHCKNPLQYVYYRNDLATIERLDNSIGHIKSNCVLCCLHCNNRKLSSKAIILKKN